MGAKTPPTPDYKGAAEAQGQANVDAARASSKLSNPNVITPFGNQTVEYGVGGSFDQPGFDQAQQNYQQQLAAYLNDPQSTTSTGGTDSRGTPYGGTTTTGGIPKPTQPLRADFTTEGDQDIPTVTQTFSPENQALYDQELRINKGLGDIAEGGIGRVDQLLGTPFDMSTVPERAVAGQEGWDNAYNALVERNQPFQERTKDRTINRLSNQGIYAGSEAYDEAMRDLERQENDFNLGAQAQATGQQQAQFGMQDKARANELQQQSFLRQLPLNELMALQSGTQIQAPQFQQFQGQQIAPPPLFQATNAQYQADLGRANAKNAFSGNLMSGLFGLGSAGLGMGSFKL